MTMIVLGNACSGKKSFIEKLGASLVEGSKEYYVNNEILPNQTILCCDMETAKEEFCARRLEITLAFIITHPGDNAIEVFHSIKHYVSCPIVVIMNKYDKVQKMKSEYQMKILFNKSHKIRIDNFRNRIKKINDAFKEYNVPIYNISSVDISTDEIYQILNTEFYGGGAAAPHRADEDIN